MAINVNNNTKVLKKMYKFNINTSKFMVFIKKLKSHGIGAV